eukprot:GILJ01034413.1.p1 GENE.GILJ01034413.1~~GILJ01034413.1.p1  ORF type:complete len:115 (+),score=9.18 GILJ01034413.1:412-756(+)
MGAAPQYRARRCLTPLLTLKTIDLGKRCIWPLGAHVANLADMNGIDRFGRSHSYCTAQSSRCPLLGHWLGQLIRKTPLHAAVKKDNVSTVNALVAFDASAEAKGEMASRRWHLP